MPLPKTTPPVSADPELELPLIVYAPSTRELGLLIFELPVLALSVWPDDTITGHEFKNPAGVSNPFRVKCERFAWHRNQQRLNRE
jgi:hypothetical protein